MKRINILTILTICLSVTFGHSQTLEKDNLIGMHVIDIRLDPDVTMNQFLKFYKEIGIPASEKAFPGMKIAIAQGMIGQLENRFAVLYLFESQSVRDLYFTDDGGFTAAGAKGIKDMEAVQNEQDKLGTTTYVYTDWKIL